MTDLLQILPSFPVSAFAALIPTIESHALTTTDLLTLHPTDLAKQTHLPILDLRRLLAAIQASLSDQLISRRSVIQPRLASPPAPSDPSTATAQDAQLPQQQKQAQNQAQNQAQKNTPTRSNAHVRDHLISTLDDGLDAALGGGVPTGRITEFVGESGAGKTQFLLSLCLAVQLPPPRGLGKQALYISTESGLATRRLAQMLDAHPLLADASPVRASLDNILSTATPDLESQDHILEYQVPVLLAGGRIGLLVLDSVAANYRAEFERQGSRGSNMAARSAELVRLGSLLRGFARKHDIAVVVANQVSDRFPSSGAAASSLLSRPFPFHGSQKHQQQQQEPGLLPDDSPLASRSLPPALNGSGNSSSATPLATPSSNPFAAAAPPEHSGAEVSHPALLLDHQQRWFTGWGDDPDSQSGSLKTPSLGLVWSAQISCRVALFKRPAYGRPRRIGAPLEADDPGAVSQDRGPVPNLRTWRRWMKIVFASHVKASGQGIEHAVEYEITSEGLRSIQQQS